MNSLYLIKRKLASREATLSVLNSFGSSLKRFRKEYGYTLQQIAQGICSVSYLSKVENNLIKISPFYANAINQKYKISYLNEDAFNDYNKFITNVFEMIIKKMELRMPFYQIKSRDHHEILVKFIKAVIDNNNDKALDLFSSLTDYLELFSNLELRIYHYLAIILLDKSEKFHYLVLFYQTLESHYQIENDLKVMIDIYYLRALMEIRNHRQFGLVYQQIRNSLIDKQLFSDVITIQKYHLEVSMYHKNENDFLNLVDSLNHLTSNEVTYFKAKYYYITANYQKASSFKIDVDKLDSYILKAMIDLKMNVTYESYQKIPIEASNAFFLVILYLETRRKDVNLVIDFFKKRLNVINSLTDRGLYLEFIYQEAINTFKNNNHYKYAQKISENYQALLKDML